MPQVILPTFPAEVTEINSKLVFKKENGVVVYFSGTMPVYQHREDDLQSFKMIVSQYCVLGVVTQAEIVRAFGVNPQFIKRAVKVFREKGVQGFFAAKNTRHGPGVLTQAVSKEAQGFLDEGMTARDVSQRLGLKVDTVLKAISTGRLHRPAIRGKKEAN